MSVFVASVTFSFRDFFSPESILISRPWVCLFLLQVLLFHFESYVFQRVYRFPLLQEVGHGVQTTCPYPEWPTDLPTVQAECNRKLDGVAPALHPWHQHLGQPGGAAVAPDGGIGAADRAHEGDHGVAAAAEHGGNGTAAAGSTAEGGSAASSSAAAPAASVVNEGSLDRILEMLSELVDRVRALELAVGRLRPSES